jgi:hypothetical protein
LGGFETVPAVLAGTRIGLTSVIVDGNIYVIGGSTDPDTVEQTVINSDGSFGSFAVDPGLNLAERNFHTSMISRGYVYVIGGADNNGVFASVAARAPLINSGSLEPFESVASVMLTTNAPSIAPVGDYIYAIGIDSKIERAAVNIVAGPNGPVGSFATMSDVVLIGANFDEAVAVIGNYVYLVGGASGKTPANTVERAELK